MGKKAIGGHEKNLLSSYAHLSAMKTKGGNEKRREFCRTSEVFLRGSRIRHVEYSLTKKQTNTFIKLDLPKEKGRLRFESPVGEKQELRCGPNEKKITKTHLVGTE